MVKTRHKPYQLRKKIEKIIGKMLKGNIIEKLKENYRNFPHPTTGVSPASLIFRNNRLSNLSSHNNEFIGNDLDKLSKEYDTLQKQKMKIDFDLRHRMVDVKLSIGDLVLVKRNSQNKSMSSFDKEPYKIIQID